MLKIENLKASYGSINALKNVSLSCGRNEIVAVIGSNGAGKSTLLKSISGLLTSKTGSIIFEGTDISNYGSDAIVKLGIAMIPEGRQIFSELSVYENLKVGAFVRKRKESLDNEFALVYSMFPKLEERKNQKGGSLSGGEQQMLAIGRALMSKPKLLLIDELSMGLAPIVVEKLFDKIVQIKEMGTSILLVEQNAMKALQVAEKAYVIETGQVALEGKAKDLIHDERLKKAYLGG